MNFMWIETTETPSEWQIKTTSQEQKNSSCLSKPAVINVNIKADNCSHNVVTLS